MPKDFFSSPPARLAQSVEHETLNLRVVGSSPTLGGSLFFLSFFFSIFRSKLRRFYKISLTLTSSIFNITSSIFHLEKVPIRITSAVYFINFCTK